MTPILDACCGARMFWFDKANPLVTYMDNRRVRTTLCDGRSLFIEPDVIADFQSIPYSDNSFYLVVFDPPHLLHAGESSWLATKYGVLPDSWQTMLKNGFAECFRVLKPNGILVFKWSEEQIPLSHALQCTPQRPLFGDQRGGKSKAQWIVFMKDGDGND